MGQELYNENSHLVVRFADLVSGDAVQSNQFLIVNNNEAALVDPGGDLTYTSLLTQILKYVEDKRSIKYVIASHQDPDIVASLNRWMVGTTCSLVAPQLWSRFIPHFLGKSNSLAGRHFSIPDGGATIDLGNSSLQAVPAHFLHAEGNFHFYDPISKILLTGDMGANLGTNEGALDTPFESLEEAIPTMEGFHRRYMNSQKACELWANMVRDMDVEWIVPQHGRSFKGKKLIREFLDWISQLQCGVDLLDQSNYRVPDADARPV